MRGRLLLALLPLLAGCQGEASPRDQWHVTLRTDAPVPQFGDRLLVEVETDGESDCAGCRHQFGVGDSSEWPISFGVRAPHASLRTRLRARLYRSRHVAEDGGPPSSALIDVMGYLPDRPDGVVAAEVFLGMNCFGKTADPIALSSCRSESGQVAPIEPFDSTPNDVQPGSWAPAETVPCRQTPESGMRCIAGGAFLLGEVTGARIEPRVDPIPERLVRISPFALDESEVNVSTVRALVDEGKLSLLPIEKSPDNTSPTFGCNYTADPAYASFPVNCITRDAAQAICEARGKRLPTEAEWEFAASGRTNEFPFPWGSADSVCDFARVAWGTKNPFTLEAEDVTCSGTLGASESGPTPEGHPSDVTVDGVRNMAGNVSEWVSDDHGLYTDACWTPDAHLLEDPICVAGPSAAKAYRGASFASPPIAATVYRRYLTISLTGQPTPYVGVRCAESL